MATGRQAASGRDGSKATERGGTRSRRRPLLLAVGAVVVAALAATALVAHPATTTALACGPGAKTGVLAGQCAPNFTLADSQGRRVSLSSLRGHPILLHFWGIPCTTCRAEYPDFSRAVRDYAPRGVDVLMVDAWRDSAPLLHDWQASHRLPARVLVDVPLAAAVLYGVNSTPTNVFVDRAGRIAYAVSSPLTSAQYAQQFKAIM